MKYYLSLMSSFSLETHELNGFAMDSINSVASHWY